jgi:hypothetical protein
MTCLGSSPRSRRVLPGLLGRNVRPDGARRGLAEDRDAGLLEHVVIGKLATGRERDAESAEELRSDLPPTAGHRRILRKRGARRPKEKLRDARCGFVPPVASNDVERLAPEGVPARAVARRRQLDRQSTVDCAIPRRSATFFSERPD